MLLSETVERVSVSRMRDYHILLVFFVRLKVKALVGEINGIFLGK